MKRHIIAGNWKMNMTKNEVASFVKEFTQAGLQPNPSVTRILCPVFPLLNFAMENLGTMNIRMGAQNVSEHEKGAFTGEVSAKILKSLEVEYCIIGHSERRQFFQETDELIKTKWQRLRTEGISPIICIGETLSEREGGTTFSVIKSQLTTIFKDMELNHTEDMMIAYEPVWAIGTGKTATPEMAQDVHKYIRQLLVELYGDMANNIPILYGGSVKPSNLKDLLNMPDINGALIGGASLIATDYAEMIKVAGAV